MDILPGIEIIDLALYLRKQKILIIGDIHIGYEEALASEGFLVPKFQFKEILARLEKILKKIKDKLNLIIINGDIKHEFGKISNEEWRNTLKLIDFLSEHTNAKLVLIKGNHDKILGPIANKRGTEIKDYYFMDNIYVCHGHKIPADLNFQKAKTIIIGHEHPCVGLNDGVRVEKFKCFLSGKWKRKNLIVMPSMNLVTEGTDILKEALLSPFLEQNLNDFEVYIAEDKVYMFGKVKNL